MMRLLLFIVFIAVGVGVIYALTKNNSQQQQLLPIKAAIPQKQLQQEFSIEPAPSETKEGRITSFSGNVLFESRIATQPARLTQNRPVKQAEKIRTENESTASIAFDNIGTINIEQNSEVSFIQTRPSEFVLVQPEGTVIYKVNGETPFSIRALHLLISIPKGEGTVSFDEENGTVHITITDGTASVAYIDLENNTIVKDLPTDSTYIYTIETREGETE